MTDLPAGVALKIEKPSRFSRRRRLGTITIASPDRDVLRDVDISGAVADSSADVLMDLADRDLSGSSLRGTRLIGGRWDHLTGTGLKLRDAVLASAVWTGCSLIRMDARNAFFGLGGRFDVTRSSFTRCDLRGAVFGDCAFSHTVFDTCRVDTARFEVTDFTEVSFIGKYRDLTFSREPSGAYRRDFGMTDHIQAAPSLDFSFADLSWISFQGGVDLSRVRLGDRPGRLILLDWQDRLAAARLSNLYRVSRDVASIVDVWSQDSQQSAYLLVERDVLAHCGEADGAALLLALTG